MSLRWRLTLAFAVLLALLLAGLGTFQYLTLQDSLVTARVDSLKLGLRDGVALYVQRNAATPKARIGRVLTEVERQRTLRAELCTGVGGVEVLPPPADATAPSLPAGTAAELGAEALACAIVKASGAQVAVVLYTRTLDEVATAGAPADSIPRLDTGSLREASDGGRSASAVVDTQAGPRLVAAYPVGARVTRAANGVAQLSTDTTAIDEVLSGERNRLAIGGGSVLVAALVVGLLLTGRALRPLRRLTETSRRLAAGDLRARAGLVPRDDEVGTLAHSFDDMADRIEAAFAAQAESEQRMRRFIADASHELRTPVTALKGYIDVLRRGAVREPEALDAALTSMASEAERMRALVLDLLALARIDAQRPLQPEPLDLGEVVAGVLDQGVPGMPPTLQRKLPVEPLTVVADPGAVATVARNLLVNACKYAPGAAQTWSVGAEDGHAVLRVRDEGPGIPAGDLPHVFERFYRGEKTRAREEGGSGLGLSIVAGLVRAQGGDVVIESREGEGTTVTVRLPLAPRG